MLQKNVKVKFANRFEGELIATHGTAKIGGEAERLAPYDMLFGALASCLYSTFLDVAKKKRIAFERVEIEVSGEKRETIPTTLKWVNIECVIYHAQKQKGLEEAFKLATEYCSIYQTIAHVAEMTYDVRFVGESQEEA